MAVQEVRHKTRDMSVRLRRDGSGERVVFLHGAGGWPAWGPFMERLAGTYDVLMPEHPGFGLSDGPAWIRNVSDMAMYYLDFLDALGLDRPHVVGGSFGGWIAAELAVRNAARLSSLTLIAPAGVRVKGRVCGDNFIWSPEEAARNLFYDQALAERRLAEVLTEEEADRALVNRFMAARLGWEPRWFNLALERWLHRIKLPALLVWGHEDKVMPPAYAALWQERLPDARLAMIEACGHLPHIEKAEIVGRQVREFLKGAAR